ncbi:MAG: hypothetical protein ACQEP3_01870 [Patescibacteria group bacterium]
MSDIAYIGPTNYYRVFKLLGFDCFESKSEKETKELIKKLKSSHDLIFTTEDLISSGGLGVVVLPGLKENKDKTALKKQVEKALGGAVSGSFLDSE